ncbi:MAG TPA: hypothetical protein VEK39_02165 [Solirubrobacterales bacterium]|nr:hypothetical protein [Solirubrobacterales bacterium]
MRRLLALAAAAAAIIGAGCSSEDEGTPEACLAPASAYRDALEDAPGPVALDGAIAVSGCLPPGQGAADLAQVGQAMVEAATQLNGAARRDPGGGGAVALGYLVGAAQKGASATGGIHADLLRRLDAAAQFSPGGKPLPAGFERGYAKGYTAGLETG